MNMFSKNAHTLQTLPERLFASLDRSLSGAIAKQDILSVLDNSGLSRQDDRLRRLVSELDSFDRTQRIEFDDFERIVAPHMSLLQKAIDGQLAIPDFESFGRVVEEVYDMVAANQDGAVANYIPQLARVCPDEFAVSICTLDGQQINLGNAQAPFCLQSTCKPVLYCAALELHGQETVHRHIGQEPSGQSFNELTLSQDNLPHNPMINAGAIMSTALIQPEQPLADRFDYVMNVFERLSGGTRAGFNNAVYHSERATADRNCALAHYMREKGAFPENTNLRETLDLYFQFCSVELTAQQLALLAATFANAGICPTTDARVFSGDTIKNCLTLMSSCGMYDFSGEFAFKVGLPAKSGVSGVVWGVVPNLMGIAVWSPRLDAVGNSVRGVQFFDELVSRYNFHVFDSLVQSSKRDPRRDQGADHFTNTLLAIRAASFGDLDQLGQLNLRGVDFNEGDYDGRTPLHLAAAEGKLDVVNYLMGQGVDINPVDRWGNTPLVDANRQQHTNVVETLENAGAYV